MIVFGIWEADKAMLVRFNPKTDLHVEAVKYDLRLSRANITLLIVDDQLDPSVAFQLITPHQILL